MHFQRACLARTTNSHSHHPLASALKTFGQHNEQHSTHWLPCVYTAQNKQKMNDENKTFTFSFISSCRRFVQWLCVDFDYCCIVVVIDFVSVLFCVTNNNIFVMFMLLFWSAEAATSGKQKRSQDKPVVCIRESTTTKQRQWPTNERKSL